MIFRFSEQEQQQILDFEKEIREKHSNIKELIEGEVVDVIENGDELIIKSGEKSAEEEQILENIRNNFESLIEQMEAERFKALKTQKAILQSAESAIKEAITFTYNYMGLFNFDLPMEKTITIQNCKFSTKNQCNYLFTRNAQKLFDCSKDKDLKHFNVLFDSEAIKQFFTDEALKAYINLLSGTAGEKKLYKLIDDCIENSKYIYHRNKEISIQCALSKKNMPLYHGKYIKNSADVTKRQQIIEPLSNSITINEGENNYIYELVNAKEAGGINKLSTHKLFMVCAVMFTSLYAGDNGSIDYEISFPLKDYALLSGYDVIEHPTNTEEEAAKEKKRAKMALDNARRAVKKDLDILFNSSYSWKEKIKGDNYDFQDMRLISSKGIKKGKVIVEIAPSFGKYLLKHSAITQYPQALLKIDGNHENAYYIGLKISEQVNMKSNRLNGTANILGVKTLLGVTKLPQIETLRKQEESWKHKIKEPFEQALDYLKSKQFIKSWEYTKAKGQKISSEEIKTISYENYESLYLRYKLEEEYK